MDNPFSFLKARREAEDARKKEAEARTRAPIEQFDSLVQGVLTQLRDSAYPRQEVGRTDLLGEEPPMIMWWIAPTDAQVEAGTTRGVMVTLFLATANSPAHCECTTVEDDRTEECSPDREALVQALVRLCS